MIYQKRKGKKIIIKRWHVTIFCFYIFTCLTCIQIVALSCSRKISRSCFIFGGMRDGEVNDTFPQSFKLTTCSGPFRGNLFTFFSFSFLSFWLSQQSNKLCKTFIVTWIHAVCTHLMNLFCSSERLRFENCKRLFGHGCGASVYKRVEHMDKHYISLIYQFKKCITTWPCLTKLYKQQWKKCIWIPPANISLMPCACYIKGMRKL